MDPLLDEIFLKLLICTRQKTRRSAVVRRRSSLRIRRRLRTAGSNTEMQEPIVIEEQIHIADESCIDLTSSVDEEFVDLTSSQRSHQDDTGLQGANDNSVVIIETPNASPPARRRGHRNLPRPLEIDDDDDLPPVPFDLSNAVPLSSSSNIQSPDAIKITCPVCLDDDKTIRREKRKLATTTCGHVFCQSCVEGSIKSQHCCPVCRKRLTLRNIFILHI